MATEIEIKYCRHCGQLESMHSMMDYVGDKNLIKVWCACGAEPPRTIELEATEPYILKVETRKEEATEDDDPDSGDVPAGGEAGRESDA